MWIIEGGKFDIAELISKGSEMIEAAEVAIEQGLGRALEKYKRLFDFNLCQKS